MGRDAAGVADDGEGRRRSKCEIELTLWAHLSDVVVDEANRTWPVTSRRPSIGKIGPTLGPTREMVAGPVCCRAEGLLQIEKGARGGRFGRLSGCKVPARQIANGVPAAGSGVIDWRPEKRDRSAHFRQRQLQPLQGTSGVRRPTNAGPGQSICGTHDRRQWASRLGHRNR